MQFQIIYSLFFALCCSTNVRAAAAACPSKPPYCVTNVGTASKFHCGKHGHLDSPYKLVKKSCIASFEDCRNVCLESSSCQSFAYNAASNTCRIYPTSSVRGMFRKGPKEAVFYDRKCFHFSPLNTSSLIFRSTTDGEDNNMYPAFADRQQESVVILGAQTNASTFAIDPSSGAFSTLNSNGETVIANQNNAKFGQELYFNPQSEIASGGYRAAVCKVSTDLVLHCSTGHNRTIMFDDGGVVALASPTDAAGYPLLTLTAVC